MLVLSRELETAIRIGSDVTVKVLSIQKQRVKLGISAPSHVRVWREEIAPPADEASPLMPAKTSIATRKFPVLVVEDDPAHARLISRALEECPASPVTIVPTGEAAIEALRHKGVNDSADRPHLILLDLHLPDLPGLEVLRQIRATPKHHMTPVVILSAERNDSMVAECLEAGANAFVNKSGQNNDFRQSVSHIVTFWCNECRIPVFQNGQSA